jgi:hypothetical protein
MSAAAAAAVRIFLMTFTSIDSLVTAPKTDPEPLRSHESVERYLNNAA